MIALPVDRRQTPGGYMRDCRERAGLTVDQVARRIALNVDELNNAARDITWMEANGRGSYGRLVQCLRDFAVFPFDYAHFIALAAETCDPSLDPDAEV